MRATCAVARVIMNAWDTKWLKILTDNNIELLTGVRYMDDLRNFLMSIREGWRWCDGGLCWSEEWKQEDIENGKSATKRTTDILLDIMNSIMEFLRFTLEISEDFVDGKLPTLDVKIWVVDNTIYFDYFEKPMNTNLVLHAKTAQSQCVKFASLTQEAVRRLLHTSRLLPSSNRLDNLEQLSTKMASSEHKPE